MNTDSKNGSDEQIRLNKRLLKEAEEKSIVHSWFQAWTAVTNSPGPQEDSSPDKQNGAVDATDLDQDDDEEDFFAESESMGIGYKQPEGVGTDLSDRKTMHANEKLRRQLLGKQNMGSRGMTASKPRPNVSASHRNHSDNDDDEGRTRAAGSSKRPKQRAVNHDDSQSTAVTNSHDQRREAIETSNDRDEIGQEQDMSGTVTNTVSITSNKKPQTINTTKKRKTTSYLDEMLAKRSKKKK